MHIGLMNDLKEIDEYILDISGNAFVCSFFGTCQRVPYITFNFCAILILKS